MTGNIGDQNPAPVVGKPDDIVVIASDIAAGLVMRGKTQVADGRQLGGQNEALHCRRCSQFLIQTIAALTDFALELQAKQLAGHPRQHFFGLNRFGDVVRGAQFQSRHFVAHFAQGRQEYDGDIRGIGIGLEPAADFEAVDVRHHDVEKNEIGFDPLGNLKCGLAAGCRQNAMSATIQDSNQNLEIDRSVIHDEDGRGSRRRWLRSDLFGSHQPAHSEIRMASANSSRELKSNEAAMFLIRRPRFASIASPCAKSRAMESRSATLPMEAASNNRLPRA